MSAAETTAPIWDFVLKFYGRQGVSEACIALQDTVGIDVNMVLFLMWMAGQGRSMAAADVKTVSEMSHGWQREVVVPIRGVRRLLKANAPLVDPDTAAAYRKKVQAIELEGEQLQLNAMAALSASFKSASAPPEQAARANLQAFQQMAGKPFPQAAVDTFVRALTEVADGK
jgi:uncharacterized protein (TIGR02444 family)